MWFISTSKARIERMGVSAAEHEFSSWGWLFRGEDVADYGIDAHVEPFSADGQPSGRPIALQIKAGASYFRRRTDGGWTYRGTNRHLRYWLGHVLPVVLILYDPESRTLYWQHITEDRIVYTDTAWTVLVPDSQVVCPAAVEQFRAIAETTVGAAEDPIAAASTLLPATAFQALTLGQSTEPDAAMRLVRLLVEGRFQPRLTVETVLAARPSWLERGSGRFEAALGAYANEHGHQDLALEAFVTAADRGSSDSGRLYGIAALLASTAGDRRRALDLLERADAIGGESLLLSVARAYLEADGAETTAAAAVDQLLSNVSPQQLAAEPTCLMFLGEQAARRGDLDTAARHFEAVLATHPRLAGARLGLARALIGKIAAGTATIPAKDQRRVQDQAIQVRDEVRQWAGPSEKALVILLQERMLSGAFHTVVDLAMPESLGGQALDREASYGEVAIYGAQAALALRDRDRAARFAGLAGSAEAETFIRALTADPTLPRDDRIDLWRAGMRAARTHEHQRRALYELAQLGVAEPEELDEFQRTAVIDDTQRQIFIARSEAARGAVQAAVMRLRRHAPSDPAAGEMLVEVLRDAGRIDEAIAECDRGLERFNATKFAHDKLNMLVAAGRIDDANALARRLLAGPDLAVEQRLALRRALVDSHAERQQWTQVEHECREALAEDLDTPDLAWWLIAAQYNQGRFDAAWSSMRELNPGVTLPVYVGLWLELHSRFGFSEDDVRSCLGFVSRWPGPRLAGHVFGCLLDAVGRQTPSGAPVLPAMAQNTIDMFQSALQSHASGYPDGPAEDAALAAADMPAASGDSQPGQPPNFDALAAQVHAGKAPLGALAASLGRSHTRMLAERACGPLHAVKAEPDALGPERAAAAAAIDHDIVIDVSTLAVATELIDRWPTLRSAFANPTLPRTALADIGVASSDLIRVPGNSYAVRYDPTQHALTRMEMSLAEHQLQRQRIIEIQQAARDLTLADPTTSTMHTPDGGPQPSWLASVDIARSTGLPLWCDDLAVRAIAVEQGIATFGTYALLAELIARKLIPDTLQADTRSLMEADILDLAPHVRIT